MYPLVTPDSHGCYHDLEVLPLRLSTFTFKKISNQFFSLVLLFDTSDCDGKFQRDLLLVLINNFRSLSSVSREAWSGNFLLPFRSYLVFLLQKHYSEIN